jgi:hypothetical protein
MKKTVFWENCKDVICAQSLQILGTPVKAFPPKNFVELVSSYPNVSKKAMTSFFQANLEKNCFVDVSKEVFQKEDECLFISGKKYSTALEVILRYLGSNQNAAAVWCYLDFSKKAVVHFIDRNGLFAEAYFLSDKEDSAIHLIQDENLSLFIPVVFTTDLSEVMQNVALRGGHYLQDYLATDTGDLLSKKSCKKSVPCTFSSTKKGPDKGDSL